MEVRLLGPLEVIDDAGGRVEIRGAKPRLLLAALALDAGRVVSVDRLTDLLWGDEPPETAANALQVYVSQLRKAGLPLALRGAGYVLEVEPEAVDVHRHERLVEEARSLPPADAAERLR